MNDFSSKELMIPSAVRVRAQAVRLAPEAFDELAEGRLHRIEALEDAIGCVRCLLTNGRRVPLGIPADLLCAGLRRRDDVANLLGNDRARSIGSFDYLHQVLSMALAVGHRDLPPCRPASV
jgi:hypothetical protein